MVEGRDLLNSGMSLDTGGVLENSAGRVVGGNGGGGAVGAGGRIVELGRLKDGSLLSSLGLDWNVTGLVGTFDGMLIPEPKTGEGGGELIWATPRPIRLEEGAGGTTND